MHFARWGVVLIALLAWPVPVWAQGASLPAISAPTAGQILQGGVSIVGTTDVPNFAFAELDFAYASDARDTWFFIRSFSTPVHNAALTTWATTLVTDGDYRLRLRVTLLDGTLEDAFVDVRVQNQSPLRTLTPTVTETPEPALDTSTPGLPTETTVPTMPPFATATPLQANPASMTADEIYTNLKWGAFIIALLFAAFAVFIRLRQSQ